MRFSGTIFWTQNSGPKLENLGHLGTKIVIIFSFFLFRGRFLSQIVQNCETRLPRPFFWSWSTFFGAVMIKKRQKKNTCAGVLGEMRRVHPDAHGRAAERVADRRHRARGRGPAHRGPRRASAFTRPECLPYSESVQVPPRQMARRFRLNSILLGRCAPAGQWAGRFNLRLADVRPLGATVNEGCTVITQCNLLRPFVGIIHITLVLAGVKRQNDSTALT